MVPARFWAKVTKFGENGCWLWTGATRKGYAAYWHEGRVVRGHRFLYELLFGVVPDGLVLDHACRRRECVNPTHLRVVTQTENLHGRADWQDCWKRCREAGHEANGEPGCRDCLNARQRAWYLRRKELVSA